MDSISVSQETWERVSGLPKLKTLDLANIEAVWIGDANSSFLNGLQLLRLKDCGISSERLKKIRADIPGTKVELLKGSRSYSEQPNTSLSAEQTLSKHDRAAYEQMKSAFDRLFNAMQAIDPPATNEFNPAATELQIAQLEHRLGMPLPPLLRAYLECHNGQPSRRFEFISCEWMRPIDDMVEMYEACQSDAEAWSDVWEPYDFNKDLMAVTNRNLFTFASSEDHVLSVHLVDDCLTFHNSESEPERSEHTIKTYLDGIAAQLEAGRFDRPHEINDFWPKNSVSVDRVLEI
jgi:hypothetical protein